ncbi:MAG TPA: RDD family protein [Acidimicrobiales bacterium]|nr:RDD family protein [Acidimicrobiales bacterium]
MFGRIVGTVVQAMPVDEVVERVDVDQVVNRVDVESVVDRIDMDGLLQRIDIDALLARIDPNALLDRVDANALLDRVDPDRLLARVDANALLDRVEVDRLLDRVDLNRIVERTELRAIVAQSTSSIFGQLLDAVRLKICVVDHVVQGLAGRLVGRKERGLAPGSPRDRSLRPDLRPLTVPQRAVALQGQYAGSVSRFLAFLLDQLLVALLFAAGAWLSLSALQVVTGHSVTVPAWFVAICYGTWEFVYHAAQLAATGRTVGKALLGLLVVEAGGGPLRARAAVVRTLVFPLSFLLFGVGFLIGLFRRDRRELHDLLAGTAVVYAWDASTAQLRAQAVAQEILRDGAAPVMNPPYRLPPD